MEIVHIVDWDGKFVGKHDDNQLSPYCKSFDRGQLYVPPHMCLYGIANRIYDRM